VTHLLPGDGATLGHDGTTGYQPDDTPSLGSIPANSRSDNVPEHRRGDSPAADRPAAARTSSSDAGGDSGGGDDGGDDGGDCCNCI
jgi:hypothetical protein